MIKTVNGVFYVYARTKISGKSKLIGKTRSRKQAEAWNNKGKKKK